MKKIIVFGVVVVAFVIFGISVRAEGFLPSSSPILMSDVTYSKSTPSMKISSELQLGSRSEDVKTLQRFLAQTPAIYPGGFVTGYFGSLTKAAVNNFQMKNGLAVTGRVDAKTLEKINESFTKGGAPIISGVKAKNIKSDTTEIEWTTSQPGTTEIFYSTGELFSTKAVTMRVSSKALSLSHVIDVGHLNFATKYNYLLLSANSLGTATSTSELSFTTPTTTPATGY